MKLMIVMIRMLVPIPVCKHEKVDASPHEFLSREGPIAERLHLLLDSAYIRRAFRLHQDVGDRVSGIGNVLNGSLICRVKGWNPE